ncbi:MAG: hypothetical protein DME97_14960 [Verrucomicrobia bacterium]|nr:MAG: hypothetical protein DME97_14960 [Verrucomicrobiota bacterium]
MRRALIATVEIIFFSALILATRCANYGDVFVGGEVYFTDADCYSRMTRVRMCAERPGLILRQHSFENFPAGTTPHTTSPFDYLIVALSGILKPITARAVDLAGAIISPLLALLTGWFLWWWSWRALLRYRGALLLLFAVSPILVHGTELGRPDHQSLLLALIAVAVCAEWSLASADSRGWSLVSGAAWGLALWVSFYEPLILLAILLITQLLAARKMFLARDRLVGWVVGGAIVLLALAIEQRLPAWPGNSQIFSNWSATIGELSRVSINDPIWLRWTGLLLLPLPALLWLAVRRTRTLPVFLAALLLATFALTFWQARWAYFFVMMFALVLPACLGLIRNRIAVWLLIVISLFPILKDWDEKLWPNESQTALIAERRFEAVAWRQAARQIDGPFLAPWWWSPAVAYWSGQPGVGGSSHEALDGIEQTARFFLAPDSETARKILLKNKVAWVCAYDADRTVANSAFVLGIPAPENPLGRVLDRTPSQAPPFLGLAAQNPACKLFRVHFFQEKENFRR